MADEHELLARAQELADLHELAEQIMIILGRARSSRVDQEALGGPMRAIKILGGDGARAVRTASRGHGSRFRDDRAMFTAIDEAADACVERDQAVKGLAAQVRAALQRAHDELDEAREELAAARAMPVDDPCDGCHEDRAEAIAEAEEHIREVEERIEVLEEAQELLAGVHADEAAYQLETVGDDYEDLYASVLALVRADPQAMPEDGDFITGFRPRGLELPPWRDARPREAPDQSGGPQPAGASGQVTEIASCQLTCGHTRPVWSTLPLQVGDRADCVDCDATEIVMRLWPTAAGAAMGVKEQHMPEQEMERVLRARHGLGDQSWREVRQGEERGPTLPGGELATAAGRIVRLADRSGRKVQRTWPDGSWDCPWCHSLVIAGEQLPDGWGCASPACVANMNAGQLALWRQHLTQRRRDQRDRDAIGQFNAEMARKRGEEEEVRWQEVEAQRVARGGCLLCLQRSAWRSGRPHIVRHRNPDHHGDGQRWQPDEVPAPRPAEQAAGPQAVPACSGASTSYDVDAIVAKLAGVDARYRGSAAIHHVTGLNSGGGVSPYSAMVSLVNELRHGRAGGADVARWQVEEGFSREGIEGQADRAEAIAQVLDQCEHADHDVRQWMPEHPEQMARVAAGLHEYARVAREALTSRAPETVAAGGPS